MIAYKTSLVKRPYQTTQKLTSLKGYRIAFNDDQNAHIHKPILTI